MLFDDGGKLALVNKTKRRKLVAALSELDGEDTRAVFSWGGREPSDNRHDTGLLMVQVIGRNPYGVTDWDFHTLIDFSWQGEEVFSKHYRRLSSMQEFIAGNDNGNTFNPETSYIVPREKPGRPRRELSDDERGRIESMRRAGYSINAIAAELHISNRRVIDCCRDMTS